mmetsp:Transcript_29595/g.61687  ORF Transcript_29595/g.61687 Transcript_29595/m.61687 type:complete len:365 (+) Transcript_29595:57-1151(+)
MSPSQPQRRKREARASLHRLQNLHLIGARRHIQVLELIEEGALLASINLHLRVYGPSLNRRLLHTSPNESLAVAVLSAPLLKPVHALGKAFERRGRGMHAVVPNVGLAGQAQILPIGKDLATERVLGRILGISRPQHLAAEVLPAKLGLIPFHGVVVDCLPRRGEGASHGHEEGVEDVELLAIHVHEAAIEATPKLLQLPCLLRLAPSGIEFLGRAAELLAGIQSIEDNALLQRIFPLEAEGFLEFVLGDIQLRRLEDRGLRGDCVVVLIDELLLIDDLRGQGALRGDLEALSLQPIGDQLVGLVGYSMGLHEDKCRVLRRPGACGVPQPSPNAGSASETKTEAGRHRCRADYALRVPRALSKL